MRRPATRVKVYQWVAEQQRDEADAVAQGWHVKRREPWDNGTLRVTYEMGASAFRVGWREVAIGFLVLLTAIIVLGSQ